MKLWSVFLAAVLAMPAQASVRYTATILETPEGLNMQTFGLNNNGETVGGVEGAVYQAYHRSADGNYRALGGLGGNRSTAVAITDNGTIAGMARTGNIGATSLPFIIQPGGAMTAISLPENGSAALTGGVNNAGVVVGTFQEPFGTGRHNVAFRWSADKGLEVNRNDYFREAVAVNAAGDAVINDIDGALRWNADGSLVAFEKMAGLSPVFDYANVQDINDAGLAAGGVTYDMLDGSVGRIAVWGTDGKLVRTGALAEWRYAGATAINLNGDIVGNASRPVYTPEGWYLSDESTAMLWLAGEAPVTLNSVVDLPGIDLQNAFEINDRGQIIATGVRGGLRVDVLLTPGTGGVPEPASWAMMILGLAAAGGSLRRDARLRRLTAL